MDRKAKAEAKFRAVVASKGGEVIGDYTGIMTKVRLRCAEGHEWLAIPNNVANHGTWCPTCPRKSSEMAETKFREIVSANGGEIIGDYNGTMNKVRLRCAEGHEWEAIANNVANGGTWCPTCANVARMEAHKGMISSEAEAKFRTVVASKGGVVVGDYAGTRANVRLRCVHGHEWEAKPNSVVHNGTWCPTCAGASPEAAEAKFRSVVDSKGSEVLGEYVNTSTKVRLRCSKGHEWEAKPHSVVHQGAWCPTCAGNTSEIGEAKFRAVVASKGGKVLGDYVNTSTKVPLRCAEGHEWEAKPNSVGNGFWCPTCAKKIFEVAEARFRAVVSERGGKVLGDYVNTKTKVRLRCAEGHEWVAMPKEVVNKGTWCPTCAIVARRAAPRLPRRQPRMNKAEERFRTVVASKGGEVLGDYVNATTKVRLRCRHGHEWEATPTSIANRGTWCPTCAGRSPEAAEARFRTVVTEKGGEVVGGYRGVGKNIRLRCDRGHEWEARPAHVTNGSWCPKCANVARSETPRIGSSPWQAEERFRATVVEKGGEVVGHYTNNHTKVRLRCSHGHEWEATPLNVVHHGSWCPTCAREAHGAKITSKGTKEAPVPATPAASDMSLAALVLAMSRVGVDRIEEGNARQAFSRIAIWQKIAGPVVLDGRKVAIGAKDIERNVGLVLPGVETLTADGFERRLGELVAGA